MTSEDRSVLWGPLGGALCCRARHMSGSVTVSPPLLTQTPVPPAWGCIVPGASSRLGTVPGMQSVSRKCLTDPGLSDSDFRGCKIKKRNILSRKVWVWGQVLFSQRSWRVHSSFPVWRGSNTVFGRLNTKFPLLLIMANISTAVYR